MVIARLVHVVPVGEARADYSFRILRVYRGKRRLDRDETIAVRSYVGEASCGFETRLGEREGLLLDRRHDRWRGNRCLTVEPRKLRRAAERLGFAKTRGC